MQTIDAILFEPVGTLAEFPGGSQPYWERVQALDVRRELLTDDERQRIEASEIEAVEQAVLYEDAAPALSELTVLGVRLIAASSLSEIALTRFLDRASLGGLFHDRWSRDRASGVAHVVIRKAIAVGPLAADRVLFLADTETGVRAARQAGVQPVLMMNDPDEAMRLTALEPAGGIVSLHELPDFVRFVAARQR